MSLKKGGLGIIISSGPAPLEQNWRQLVLYTDSWKIVVINLTWNVGEWFERLTEAILSSSILTVQPITSAAQRKTEKQNPADAPVSKYFSPK